MDDLIQFTQERLESRSNPADRKQMIRYMKNHFDFFGVKSPARKEVLAEVKKIIPNLNMDELFDLSEKMWNLPQREFQYMALDLLTSKAKKMNPEHLPKIERLITEKSWWDTVDGLSPNIAGSIFHNYPDTRIVWISKWNKSENMWLNRSALIHQLRYKEAVDLNLLFKLIETHIGSKEFFINKASGWALRQASKFHPQDIQAFINKRPDLSNLTKREGSKYL